MNDVVPFATTLVIIAAVGLTAVLSHRFVERFPIPAPALFLIGAAVASDIWQPLAQVPTLQVERVVTIALVVILFDGGMQLGWRRVRANAGAIVWLGATGTLLTAVALAVGAHLLFGLDWRIALLLGTALSPTDPAVVFSVLGRRQIGGRSGVLLQGESGANDPVGIALMVVLLGTSHFTVGAAGSVAWEFTTQLLIGAVIGVLGGTSLLWFMRSVLLPAAGLYSLRVLMCVFAIYAVTTLAHGSGFLAVLVAGVVVGDQRAPYKIEIERFHSALANLAEIVAFVMLGLTIQITGPGGITEGNALGIGLGLAALLALLIRPLAVVILLWRTDLNRGERLFVSWTGLKGAVPILLGVFIVQAGVADAQRAYDIIFVVVAFSVIVQGGAVPALARRLGIPLETVNPRPWGMNARFEEEPNSLHRFTIGSGAPADGTSIAELPSEDLWVSVLIRQGRLVTVTADTLLRAGDEILVLAEPDTIAEVAKLFGCTATPRPVASPTPYRLRTRLGRGWFRKPAPPEADC
ncbi:sodium:proton exchanger [Nocardia sp. ET3-3]|uniref:Sodium:proton exchanger n=1 Tax=Nocardia terrae TaxID=2675851 RepID=A0A7K1V1H2_9NOCA|nr:cation:proton antiporter [Nocardia terrae]MVU80381.1 sodium:proton exchanger [Nocardia terrae]